MAHCFYMCGSSALLGDPLWISRSMEREFLSVMSLSMFTLQTLRLGSNAEAIFRIGPMHISDVTKGQENLLLEVLANYKTVAGLK